jgi:hypothetical protein
MGVRKEVERSKAGQLESAGAKQRDIAGERNGVAGDIDDLRRVEFEQFVDNGFSRSRPGRVKDDGA